MRVLLYCLFIIFFSPSCISALHDTSLTHEDTEDRSPIMARDVAARYIRERLCNDDCRIYSTWRTNKGRMWVVEVPYEDDREDEIPLDHQSKKERL